MAFRDDTVVIQCEKSRYRSTFFSFGLHRIAQMPSNPCKLATGSIPHRLGPGDPALCDVLDLIRRGFAGMDGRIDPPSSMHRLTVADLSAPTHEVWAIGMPPRACVVLTPRSDTLYLGKLAVADHARGHGLARVLVEHAIERASALGLPSVTLQVRVELIENHATFARLGFAEVARTAHPGYDRPTSVTFRRAVFP